MNAIDKIKKSWWVIFPFTFLFPGMGLLYIGLKFNNRNWIVEGITYEVPWFFFFLSSAIYHSQVISSYYVWILILTAFIALVRSIMVAIKLAEVYDIGENSTATHVSSGSPISKAKDDSKLGGCCICVIFIFIVFAFVAIL
ncbi:hypothetical protein [uncultured Methanobrevibacter sp.]|uniref:hypothetical protein n=1 Tax=uncultured Methanobrevibacter sp. TaxID=253161 RepID=UPI0025D0630F|nr:hypothetical protein [uncultured Methanobrevibacter sp.]